MGTTPSQPVRSELSPGRARQVALQSLSTSSGKGKGGTSALRQVGSALSYAGCSLRSPEGLLGTRAAWGPS